MKEHFTKEEMTEIVKSHHGGLKFVVSNENNEEVLSCYRTTIGGGLDYCNNQADKIDFSGLLKVDIYDRFGTKRGQWKKIAWLEREKNTIFNH